MMSEHNAVVFKVASDATKPEIKAAVEALFNVSVTNVNTIVQKGKTKKWKGALHALRHQEGDRHAEGRSVHRRDARGQRVMALKHYNPTSPARRGLILIDRSGLFKGRPVKALTEGKQQDRRPQQQGPCDLARHRRRSQAEVSHRRLQAPLVGRRRHGRADRIRSQPHRLHRAGQLWRGRGRQGSSGLYHRAAASRRRRQGRRGQEDRREAGQRDGAGLRCRSARSSTTSR